MNCKHDFFYEDYREIPICKHCNKSAYVIINELQQAHNALKEKLKIIVDTFKKDIEQGYKTKDKEYVIDILSKALKE